MKEKDYYKIMGISEDASDKDIKMAYRKLARKYHPDVSKEPNAEEQFKEVGEAYETLRDPKKRKEYDQFRKNWQFRQTAQKSPHDEEGDSYEGQTYQFDNDFFESLFGHSRYRHHPIAGQDFQGKITITLEEAYQGTVKNVQIPIDQGGEVKIQTLKVKIPSGIKSGQQIRLAGQGGVGIDGGPQGHLFLTISVEKHPLFDVIDNDIYLTLPITPWEAALGTTVVVPTLSGKIDLKIPQGSQGGQKLRIKNRGLPGKVPGHQYVLLKIITPPPTSDEAIELYKKMANLMPFNPRTAIGI